MTFLFSNEQRFSRFVWGTLSALLLFSPFQVSSVEPPASGRPRYVFYFIGDGMGFEQVQLANLARAFQGEEPMQMSRLPMQGRQHTRSLDREITDSAASATALASGVKTNSGMIGMTPDETPVESISLKLLAEGMKIGVVANVPINHATPAGFFSHVRHRSMVDEIAEQMVGSGVHFFAGSGLLVRERNRDNWFAHFVENGMAVVTDIAEATDFPADRRMLLAAGSLRSHTPVPGDLTDALTLAIDRLRNPDGFFIMIEGGAIDWVCHANLAWEAVLETLAMDRAVEVAYRFYLENPDDTLILITADHETGGLSVDETRLDVARLQEIDEARRGLDRRIPRNAEEITLEIVRDALAETLGVTELTEADEAVLQRALDASANRRRNEVLRIGRNIAQAPAGVRWSTGGHTGVDVPVYAVGPGAEVFVGAYDNTAVPQKLFTLITGKSLFQTPAEVSATRP